MFAVHCGSRNPEIICVHQSLEHSAGRRRVRESAPIAARRRPLLVNVFMFRPSHPLPAEWEAGDPYLIVRRRRRDAANSRKLRTINVIQICTVVIAALLVSVCTVIRTHRAHIRHSRDYLQTPFTSNSVPPRHFTAITCPKFNDVV